MKHTSRFVVAACTALALAGGVSAQSQGDWTLGVGLGGVFPDSDNGTVASSTADVDEGYALTITGEYFFLDNWGIELLAATQFKHDVSLSGSGEIGSVKHLPPTLSVNYHFPTQTVWKPYLGIGVNYTTFSDESSRLGDLELDDSWGVAVQAGIDYAISDRDAFRANIRWIDIDSDVRLDGAKVGTAEIDPIVLNFAYVRRF
ncbi:OmpW family outer membrane protein [uncultured Tateyamaria sp.]|uniref:OmpW/AlkL family protein n=1 Tax=uncultured Tateyamaria sp. TaxID=455651 RepID=UPI00262360C7|nr:OmpW family outer membrane protein [uncultured Tateyamaria sp.]